MASRLPEVAVFLAFFHLTSTRAAHPTEAAPGTRDRLASRSEPGGIRSC